MLPGAPGALRFPPICADAIRPFVHVLKLLPGTTEHTLWLVGSPGGSHCGHRIVWHSEGTWPPMGVLLRPLARGLVPDPRW